MSYVATRSRRTLLHGGTFHPLPSDAIAVRKGQSIAASGLAVGRGGAEHSSACEGQAMESRAAGPHLVALLFTDDRVGRAHCRGHSAHIFAAAAERPPAHGKAHGGRAEEAGGSAAAWGLGPSPAVPAGWVHPSESCRPLAAPAAPSLAAWLALDGGRDGGGSRGTVRAPPFREGTGGGGGSSDAPLA